MVVRSQILMLHLLWATRVAERARKRAPTRARRSRPKAAETDFPSQEFWPQKSFGSVLSRISATPDATENYVVVEKISEKNLERVIVLKTCFFNFKSFFNSEQKWSRQEFVLLSLFWQSSLSRLRQFWVIRVFRSKLKTMSPLKIVRKFYPTWR